MQDRIPSKAHLTRATALCIITQKVSLLSSEKWAFLLPVNRALTWQQLPEQSLRGSCDAWAQQGP